MGKYSDLSERFFAAAAAGDGDALREICAPRAGMSQNGAPAMDMDGLVALASAVRTVMPDYRYETSVCLDTETGFVDEHDILGTLADGTQVKVPACIVATVENGKITGLREYFDSAAAAPLFKALGM